MSLISMYYYYGKIRSLCHHYLLPYYFTPNLILDNIYIGDIYDAHNIEELEKNNINNVISIVPGCENIYNNIEYKINHNCFQAIDNLEQDLTQYFEKTSSLIENIVEKKEKVLIHCICGVSRSVTILLAYLIIKRGYTLKDGLELIKNKRPIANPNESFLKQLNMLSLI